MNSFSLTTPRTIASLTNDDSKILGNLEPKLKKVKEQFNLETKKYKTLNSSWTPLKDKNSNQIVFEERLNLVTNWFDLWNDKQRKWFLLNILSRCRPSQLCFLEEAFDHFGVYERKDFTTILPKYLSVYIFSFLSPQDLCRCAQVSSHWRYLAEQDEIWMPKCLKFGWYLPYKPSARELGAWKAHYINCIQSINAVPLTKEEAYRYRDILFRRDLTDHEKEKYLYLTTKRVLDPSDSYDSLSTRKAWTPSSKKPKDLTKTDKYLYSSKADPNQLVSDNSLNVYYNTIYNLPKESLKPHLKTLNTSKLITNDMIIDFRHSLPAYLSDVKDVYKTMRKSENDFFKTSLTKSSFNAYLTYRENKINDNPSLSISNYETKQNDKIVLFISSKVPCKNFLLHCVKQNVTIIDYEYETTNINSLINLLDSALNGKKSRSIGFFLHFEKPGQIPITSESNLYKINVNDEEISNFYMKLVERLSDQSKSFFDFFLPLGSSIDGLELVDKLSKLTGVQIRIPTGFLMNYKFIKSKWMNVKDLNSSPVDEYFSEDKLNLWLKYCDVLSDASDRLSELVMNGYLPDLTRLAVNKISGEIIFDLISKNEFLTNKKIQSELFDLISKSASNRSEKFFANLFEELKNKISNTNGESKLVDSDNLSISESVLKNFIKNKSEVELIEQNMRVQIILELIKSELNYFKSLEIIQVYYLKPLKSSLESNKKVIVSQSVLDMLFSDLSIFYNTSKQMVKEFNNRLKEWTLNSCVVDIMKILVENIQSYLNYVNNIDSIINTVDKLITSNAKFRDFLLLIDNTSLTGMKSIQELMQTPWIRVKEYMNILGSLQLHTAKNHPDQDNISLVLNKIRQVYLYIKQMQEKVENRYNLVKIQNKVLNSPDILKPGRYLILEQKANLLNKLTLDFVKEIKLFLFNDGLLITFKINKHFAFKKHAEEVLIYYDLIDGFYNFDINQSNQKNIILLKSGLNEHYLAFDSLQEKLHFFNSLKSARKQSLKNQLY